MLVRSHRTLDIFISHAWRYHEDWTRFSNMLDAHDPRAWRNFSLPWFDPALIPSTESGGEKLRWSLESQIIPAHAMILLASVFAQQGARKWIDFEIETARKHSKPIIALPATGEVGVPAEITSVADAIGTWDAAKLLGLIDEMSVNGTKSGSEPPTSDPPSAPR